MQPGTISIQTPSSQRRGSWAGPPPTCPASLSQQMAPALMGLPSPAAQPVGREEVAQGD